MKTNYRTLCLHPQWHVDNSLSQKSIPANMIDWMLGKGSLTTALVELSKGQFEVNVLGQRLNVPVWHEQNKLKCPLYKIAMIREVELKLHGDAVVFARSIIPLALATKSGSGLANLGRTPLGHLLFKDGKIHVSKREFAQIKFDSQVICARRTPYDYMGSTILVSEFFLPSFTAYL